jgi:hypothetical protein
MIKFIGNYVNSIPESWIPFMNQHTGEIRPNKNMVITKEVLDQQKKWKELGYDDNDSVFWELFHDFDLTENLKLDTFDFCISKQVQWWIAKLKPGHCFPIHTDTIKDYQKNAKRYWIALEDYKWGHIFLIDNICLRDYKKGDVFEIDNSPHGSANIGLENKYSLQLLTFD